MKLGTNIRNWGNGSDPATLLAATRLAEAGDIDTVWVNERLSTPAGRGWREDDGGRYLDAMVALGYIAAVTTRIGLGTGVLNAPYRLPFQLLKQAVSVHDLSGHRLKLGLGVGWYETEFEVLGVPFRERGRRTDEALAMITTAFETGRVDVGDSSLPLLPSTPRPPIWIGGQTDAALRRVVRFGDGWIAAGLTARDMAPMVQRLAGFADQAGRPTPRLIAMKTLPLDNAAESAAMLEAWREIGVEEFVHADGYPDADAFSRRVERLNALRAILD